MPGTAGSRPAAGEELQADDRHEWFTGRFAAVRVLQLSATPGTAGWPG